jgi:hypothetical protein
LGEGFSSSAEESTGKFFSALLLKPVICEKL